ncbi:hypothetical protein ABLV18_26885 [Klebsiella sp. CN_Kp114]|uniref:hypothetical protein n=1 Tax=unclassified Klebsiella TaxID=2608929 RepID=UPI0032B36094
MTEKRGTGTEYGQDKLKDRADNYDLAADEKKPKSKLKLIGVLIIAIIGAGALYPVLFGGSKTPAEKTEEVVALNSDGVSVEDSEATKPVVANADTDKAAADKTATDKAATDKAATDKAAADKAAADKAAADKAAADKAAAYKAATDKAAADKAAADKAAADKVAAVDTSENISGVDEAEQHLLDNAAPANLSTEIVPAEKVQQRVTGQLPPEDVKGIADAVIHDPTVKATDEAKKVSQAGTEIEKFDAAKFGIGTNTVSPSVQQSRSVQHLLPVQQEVENTEQSSDISSDDMLKSYTGQSSEVPYYSQSQNTVYVYGSFAAKVYLLPIGKSEKINAYLSDSKGWEVSQLPGDILRIKRSYNKSDWSDATDLFLVAGKRTYTLILQGVDEPKLRTDSLRYIESKAIPVTKAGKK